MSLNVGIFRTLIRRRSWAGFLLVSLLSGSAACVQSDGKPTPLASPSTLALALTLSASPDVLPLDGAAQSFVTLTARDSKGEPVDVSVTLQLSSGGILQDVGHLSSRRVQTGSDGKAAFTYTVPLGSVNPAGSEDTGRIVTILASPEGTDYRDTLPRQVDIRLIPPGTTIPPFGVVPDFTIAPAAPDVFSTALFSALCADETESGCTENPFGHVLIFDWAFGDGNTASGQEVSHAYAFSGTFIVTLTVRDSFNRSASSKQTLVVGAGTPPTAVITVSPTSPNVDDTVFFSATQSTPGPQRTIVGYAWDFGDGSTGTGANVTHVYPVADNYAVVLTVTDDKGQTGTVATTVTVTASGPTAVFTVSPTAPVVGETVRFNATASTATDGRTIVAYEWFFGDGGTSGLGSVVTHSYATAEQFVVQLIVTDSFGETGTIQQNLTIDSATPTGATASFFSSPQPALVNTAVTFEASGSTASAGATIASYNWNWGDGSARQTVSSSTIQHTFTAAGTYTVSLVITDSNGVTAQTSDPVSVGDLLPPTASFTASPTTGGAGLTLTVNVDASASVPGTNASIANPAGYVWNWGDGTAKHDRAHASAHLCGWRSHIHHHPDGDR